MTTLDSGYTSETIAGGHMVIRNVPIFVECERMTHNPQTGEPETVQFDKDWIKQAVDKAFQRQKEGYMPPLHVRHHEPGLPNSEILAGGFFQITGTEEITFKGERKMAVMADLVVTNDQVAEDIKSMRLPYRSVEIFSVTEPGLDSLALLDHEAPFLELPMLSLKNSIQGTSGVANATFSYEGSGDSRSMVGFLRGKNAHLLFKASDMADDYEDKDQEEGMAEETTPAVPPPEPEIPALPEPEMPDMKGLDIKAICAAIKSGSISVSDMEDILRACEQQGALGEDVEDEQEDNPLEMDAPEEMLADAAVPGGEMMKKQSSKDASPRETVSPVRFAKLAGENKALKARLDAIETERARDNDVAEAMQRLSDKPLGADLKSELVAFHKEHGAGPFKSYVEKLDSVMGQFDSPVADLRSDVNAPAASKEVQKYADLGADAVSFAAEASREWSELYNAGMNRMPEDRYIAVSMARRGINLS